ncbi:phage major capsid protein [Succinivibrio sp.]|uniref:phage major capsid protein n=1 Tax=Succinivibrio sp. TaxID=2053619 RepID=UPI00386AC617
MTIEEIKALDMEGVENRSMEIKEEMTAENADLETLSAEVTALEERKAAIVEKMKKAQAAVAEGAGKEIEKQEERKMALTFEEVRSSEQYVNAYAEYIKTGDDKEVRSVLTELGVGASDPTSGVAVPTSVEDRIRTAWENDAILSRVKRSNVKGILKVGFELSATPAAVHAEGAAAPDPETLNLGIVSLVPETLKKWLTISDEAFDLRGQAFLDYIMDEIEYRIIKLAADTVVADITSAPTTATKTAASVAHVESTGISDIVNAIAALSDEAQNSVVIMNKQSYAYYKGLAMAAGYAVDPFDGLEVLFNNTLDVATATPASGAVNKIAIVGDLQGESVNFTNGYEPTIKVDDLSLAESDLIKVVGRLPMGHGVTACGRFAVITKTGA